MRQEIIKSDIWTRINDLDRRYGGNTLSINLVDAALTNAQGLYVLQRNALYSRQEDALILREPCEYLGNELPVQQQIKLPLNEDRYYHYFKLKNGLKIRFQVQESNNLVTFKDKNLVIARPVASIAADNFAYLVIPKAGISKDELYTPEKVQVYRLHSGNIKVLFRRPAFSNPSGLSGLDFE